MVPAAVPTAARHSARSAARAGASAELSGRAGGGDAADPALRPLHPGRHRYLGPGPPRSRLAAAGGAPRVRAGGFTQEGGAGEDGQGQQRRVWEQELTPLRKERVQPGVAGARGALRRAAGGGERCLPSRGGHRAQGRCSRVTDAVASTGTLGKKVRRGPRIIRERRIGGVGSWWSYICEDSFSHCRCLF